MTQAKTSWAARAHPTQSCKLLISNPANTSILIFETAYIMFNLYLTTLQHTNWKRKENFNPKPVYKQTESSPGVWLN